jgi:sulfite exporter TauE/SafE
MDLVSTFLSALVLGLLGSLHCVGMCGGLQALLNKPQAIRTPLENQYHLVAMNLGRVMLYSLAGAVFGFVGAEVGVQLNVPGWSVVLRQLMAIMIIIVGLQLLLQVNRPLAFLEKAGYRLWQRIQPFLNSNAPVNYLQSFRRGMLWGFLPCGLVYSVIAIALLSGSATGGLLTMLGFGVGTLPALLLTGFVLWKFKQVLQLALVRRGGGVFLILVGILILSPSVLNHTNHGGKNVMRSVETIHLTE